MKIAASAKPQRHQDFAWTLPRLNGAVTAQCVVPTSFSFRIRSPHLDRSTVFDEFTKMVDMSNKCFNYLFET